MTAEAPSGFVDLDPNAPTKPYGERSDYVAGNQAQTTSPSTATGSTYNWIAVQNDPTNSLVGYDLLASSSSFGVSEFIVSAGTKIMTEGFVTDARWGFWAVPEIAPNGTGIVVAFIFAVVGLVERRRLAAGRRLQGASIPDETGTGSMVLRMVSGRSGEPRRLGYAVDR